MIYTGIGSRETPEEVQHWMYNIGKQLAKSCTLRSGRADGADMAFEEGATAGKGKMEIFPPWFGFNGANMRNPIYIMPNQPYAELIAAQFHPRWSNCSSGAKKMHTRNVYEILGENLTNKSDLVICWTKDGKASGGTGQALRIAHFYGIPVYNLYHELVRDNLMERLEIYL